MNERRIVFVDDEPPMHEMMATILRDEQAHKPVDLFAKEEPEPSVRATSYPIDFFLESDEAQKAIEKAHRENRPYALLITDIRMPGHDGKWLIQRARRTDPHIRVIVLTSYADATTGSLAESAGSEDFIYLEKTVSPVIIKQAIDSELATWTALHRNQRLFERLTFSQKVRLRGPHGVTGTSVDISAAGVGIVDLPTEIAVGSLVEVELDGGRIVAQGKVQWEKKEGVGYRVGIRFSQEDQALLKLATRSTEKPG